MKLDLRSPDLQLDALHFPDKLAEALGPKRTTEPALNPIPRQEAVRFVNGLPRRAPSVTWLDSDRMHGAHREAALDALVTTADRETASPAELKLFTLLDERRENKNHILAAVTRGGFSTREI